MDIAVLGMGRMGRALAGRLLEGGHRVARPGPEISEMLDLETRGHDRGLTRAAADLGADGSQVKHLVGPRQDDQVGAPESGGRFPQRSRGQEACVPGRPGVHAHDVHVDAEAPLLEAVVEDEHVWSKP